MMQCRRCYTWMNDEEATHAGKMSFTAPYPPGPDRRMVHNLWIGQFRYRRFTASGGTACQNLH